MQGFKLTLIACSFCALTIISTICIKIIFQTVNTKNWTTEKAQLINTLNYHQRMKYKGTIIEEHIDFLLAILNGKVPITKYDEYYKNRKDYIQFEHLDNVYYALKIMDHVKLTGGEENADEVIDVVKNCLHEILLVRGNAYEKNNQS
jgi:hypothetical protein